MRLLLAISRQTAEMIGSAQKNREEYASAMRNFDGLELQQGKLDLGRTCTSECGVDSLLMWYFGGFLEKFFPQVILEGIQTGFPQFAVHLRVPAAAWWLQMAFFGLARALVCFE